MEYIYKYKNGDDEGKYSWYDCMEENYEDYSNIDYVVDEYIYASVHNSIKSALYDDMTGYQDELQEEHLLNDNELYVVTYFKYDYRCSFLEHCVDFGITKDEIMMNVLANKYVEGAAYYTLGQVMKCTKDWIESGKPIEHDC